MPATTVLPDSNGSYGSYWSIVGGAGSRWASVNSGVSTPNDATYIQSWLEEFETGNVIHTGFAAMPGDFDAATAVSISVRHRANTTNAAGIFQIFQADEVTPLTNAISVSGLGGAFVSQTLNFTITGSTAKSAWDGAVVRVTHDRLYTYDDQYYDISEMEMSVTYDATGPSDSYAIASNNWDNPATWNGGIIPPVGATVRPNGFTVTINTSIDVALLTNIAGGGAAANGKFIASVAGVTIDATNITAGAERCLDITADAVVVNGTSFTGGTVSAAYAIYQNHAGSTVNGNSYGGDVSGTSGIYSVAGSFYGNSYGGMGGHGYVGASRFCVHYGDSHGGPAGSLSSVWGDNLTAGAKQYGNAYGGGSVGCYGTTAQSRAYFEGNSYGSETWGTSGAYLLDGGVMKGNAYAGGKATAHGVYVLYGGVFIGNAYAPVSGAAGARHGAYVLRGGWHVGDAFGGGVGGCHGFFASLGGYFWGNATGGTISTSHGAQVSSSTAVVEVATGTTPGAYGLNTVQRSLVDVKETVGASAVSYSAETEFDFVGMAPHLLHLISTTGDPLAFLSGIQVGRMGSRI